MDVAATNACPLSTPSFAAAKSLKFEPFCSKPTLIRSFSGPEIWNVESSTSNSKASEKE